MDLGIARKEGSGLAHKGLSTFLFSRKNCRCSYEEVVSMTSKLRYEEIVDYWNNQHTIVECAHKFSLTPEEVDQVLLYYEIHHGYVRGYSEMHEIFREVDAHRHTNEEGTE